MLIKKIKRNFSRLASSFPADKRAEAIMRAFSPVEPREFKVESIRIAVQGVEDPLFFGLFALILADIRKFIPVRGDLIQVRSINGAIGVGESANQVRSWLISRIFNNQWARVNRELVGAVAYRSQPIFWNLGRRGDRKQAVALWDEMKVAKHPERIYVDGVLVGDLVIDTYLRYRPSPRFDVHDPFVLMVLQQAIRDLKLAQRYFVNKRPRLYLSSYSTYIEHGIPVRVAISLGIPVRVYGNLLTFGKRLSPKDFFHTTDTREYRAIFEAMPISQQNEALDLAENKLKRRLSGAIDLATSYMKVSAYASDGELVPDVRGAVIIFLHDFYDSPHIYSDLVFTDFWAWICFTMQTLSDAGINFWVKPHPNQIPLSDEVLLELKNKFPESKFISSRVTNLELVNAGILCGVTVYGTVGHELAYLGIPVITCAKHPHSSFEFCRTASTLNEYKDMLLNPCTFTLSKMDMKKQALAFFYMHNLYGSIEELEIREYFINLWKVFNMGDVDLHAAVASLLQLRDLDGWKLHIDEIKEDLMHAV